MQKKKNMEKKKKKKKKKKNASGIVVVFVLCVFWCDVVGYGVTVLRCAVLCCCVVI